VLVSLSPNQWACPSCSYYGLQETKIMMLGALQWYSVPANQLMHSIKYNWWQVLIPCMFRREGTILRESFRSKEYKPNTPIFVCIALLGMIKILKNMTLINIKLQCCDNETVWQPLQVQVRSYVLILYVVCIHTSVWNIVVWRDLVQMSSVEGVVSDGVDCWGWQPGAETRRKLTLDINPTLLSALVDWYIIYNNMHRRDNMKFVHIFFKSGNACYHSCRIFLPGCYPNI